MSELKVSELFGEDPAKDAPIFVQLLAPPIDGVCFKPRW